MAAGEYQAQTLVLHIVLPGFVPFQQTAMPRRVAASRDASRRSRSMARLRAVVMIQPAGRRWHAAGGPTLPVPLRRRPAPTPRRARCRPANATSTATARPYSRRNTCFDFEGLSGSSTKGRTSMGTPMARASLRPQAGAASRSGALRMSEPADLLLALDEWAVGGHDATILVAQYGRAAGRSSSHQLKIHTPAALHFLPGGVYVTHDFCPRASGGGRGATGGITHAEQILFHGAAFVARARGGRVLASPIFLYEVRRYRQFRTAVGRGSLIAFALCLTPGVGPFLRVQIFFAAAGTCLPGTRCWPGSFRVAPSHAFFFRPF